MGFVTKTEWIAAGKSYAKVFLAVILSMFLADGADVFSVDAQDLRTWVAAGFASVLPVIINALDSSDPRYGRGSQSEA